MIDLHPPKQWTETRLDAVADIVRDIVDPMAIESGTTYVGLENIEGTGDFTGVSKVSNGDLASAKFRFSPEHVLFGKLRPYLRKIARPTFTGVCSTDILPIKPKPGISRDYLYHYLRHPRVVEEATLRCAGANLPRLSPSQLESFPIVVPFPDDPRRSLAEQKRIAAILDKADAIRRRRQEAARLADTLIPSVFYEMFGRTNAELQRWPMSPLGEFIVEGPQNGLYRPASEYGSGTRIVRIDSFYQGELCHLNELKRVRLEDDTIQKWLLRRDDLLINRVNSTEFLGKSAIVPEHDEPMVFESNMMRFRVDADLLVPRFLIAMLQTRLIKGQILKKERPAVNQSSINQDDVKGLMVPTPPIELQRDFAKRVPAMQRQRDAQPPRAEAADTLFNSLVQRAFRGEL